MTLAVLALGAPAASAQQIQQSAAATHFSPSNDMTEPRITVRQGGGGDQQGLLNKLKGPAALVDVDVGAGETLRTIAGAMDSPNGGKQMGYVAGVGNASLFGFDTKLNYAADEVGGMAVEGRLSKKLGDLRLGLSQTVNHEFESNWTGYGDTRAERISEASADWSLFSVPVKMALRETGYANGERGTDLRTVQTLQLGSGMVINSTVTGLRGRGEGDTTGSLIYYGPLGSAQLTAEVDYDVLRSAGPTSALIGIEKSIDNSWSLYAYAQQPFSSGVGRVDVGAARQIGGFMVGAYGGAAADGNTYAGLRLWIPLSPGARDHRWLGF